MDELFHVMFRSATGSNGKDCRILCEQDVDEDLMLTIGTIENGDTVLYLNEVDFLKLCDEFERAKQKIIKKD